MNKFYKEARVPLDPFQRELAWKGLELSEYNRICVQQRAVIEKMEREMFSAKAMLKDLAVSAVGAILIMTIIAGVAFLLAGMS